jgi:SAM-dependent methyltransferase
VPPAPDQPHPPDQSDQSGASEQSGTASDGEPTLAPGFYDEPLLYDVLHSAGTAAEVRGLRRLAERFGLEPRGPWLEPACGSGRFVRAAIARGVRIAGFDASGAMIAYARQRLGGVDEERYRLGVATMEGFDIDALAPGWRFALAFNPINTIRHLDRDGAVLEHLARVHAALAPGGVYAVGLSQSAYGLEQPSEDVWEGARGALHVRQVVQYTPPAGPPATEADRVEHVNSVLAVTRPGASAIIPSAYALRTYDRGQWEALLARSPFAVAGWADESGAPIDPPAHGGPGYAIWILRKA